MTHVLNTILPLFLIIFVIATLQKYAHIGDRWQKALNDFILKIGLPALLFNTIANANFSLSEEIVLILANSIFLVTGILLSMAIGKLLKLNKKTYLSFVLCFMFGNITYLGIPVLTRVSGKEILPEVSLIIAIHLFWIFTIALSYLDYSVSRSKKGIFKKLVNNLIRNPLLVSVMLGILFNLLRWEIPNAINQSLDLIGGSVTPVVLVAIGLFVGQSKIGKLKDWIPIFYMAVATLILVPGGFYFGSLLAGYQPSIFFSSIIEAAMPIAITPFAMADQYNLNKEFISKSIVLSIILSVITIPFWISIVQ